MIRYIKLQNYRSFTNLNLNLMSKNGIPLKLVILYGENGAGKSNLINVFDTLYDTIQTMSLRNMIMDFLDKNSDSGQIKDISSLKQLTDITRIIQENKTKDSDSNMSIEIGFQLNGKNGTYYIEFDNNQIVQEQLEYTIEKNKGLYFRIDSDSQKISNTIFGNAKNEFSSALERFWGKHSALALLFNAKNEFSEEYFTKNTHPFLLNILNYIQSFCVYMTNSSYKYGIIDNKDTLSPANFANGEIPVSEEYKLERAERMLNKFFKATYHDIKNVYYKKSISGTSLTYELYFSRLISGSERSISYSDESCGTSNLIYLLPYCIAVAHNRVVAIDEIDNGIHDVLLLNLVKSLYKNINGQLIITTHNTMLLNEYEFKDSFFFIDVDDTGTRSINTPADFGYRIQEGSNVFQNYIRNTFKGLPWSNMDIDFDDIAT